MEGRSWEHMDCNKGILTNRDPLFDEKKKKLCNMEYKNEDIFVGPWFWYLGINHNKLYRQSWEVVKWKQCKSNRGHLEWPTRVWYCQGL